MTYEEFEEKAEEIDKEICQLKIFGYYENNYGGKSWKYKYWGSSNGKPLKEKKVIFAEWSTGGVTGGSCWDDGDSIHYGYISNNPPEKLVLMDKILEHFNPNVTFLQYRNLESELIKYETRDEGEYYGNSTNYANISVDLEDLYKYMNEKGWIQ